MSSISRSKNVNKNKSRRRRCPKGTRRNVEGKCETASIHLLGNSKLFQLSFNKSKIRNYELVSAVESSASSFLNTSVLLGLIDIDEAKKSVKGISKRNINFKNAMDNFLQQNFVDVWHLLSFEISRSKFAVETFGSSNAYLIFQVIAWHHILVMVEKAEFQVRDEAVEF